MSTLDLETATDEENLLIANAFIASSNGLGDAIVVLKRIEATTFDPDALRDVIGERRRLEDEAAANERAFLAYTDGDIGLRPPTQADVDRLVELAAEVALLTQKKVQAAAVLALATKIEKLFDEIKGD
jgi:hypothetical protein